MITERKKPTCSNCGTELPFPKDKLPSLGPDYSMDEMLKHEASPEAVAERQAKRRSRW